MLAILASLNISHVQAYRVGGGIFGMGVGTIRACGNGAVDTQHEIDDEGSIHSCTKVYQPKKGIFLVCTTTHRMLIICYISCKIFSKYASCAIHVFLLCRLKVNHMTDI
jgi:hypothetical protein